MNTPIRSGFVNPLLACTLGLVAVGGGTGMAVVWQQHLISETANENKALEQRIAAVRRQSEQLTAEIAFESDSAALLQRNSQMKLGMVAPALDQQMLVTEDPIRHLAAKQGREMYSASKEPFNGLRLALGH
jgi:cell division protein FtsB